MRQGVGARQIWEMPGKKSLDDAAGDYGDALEKMLHGEPEPAVAKTFLVTLAVLLHWPWFVVLEPLVTRGLQRLNNKRGKDAVLEIAKEVETEEGYRRIAVEVGKYVGPSIEVLLNEHRAMGGVEVGTILDMQESSADETVRRLAILLHRMEERLAEPTGLADARKPLVAAPFLRGGTMSMKGATRPEQRLFEVRAIPYNVTPRLHFDLTNMSRLDVRLVDVFVEVVEYREIDIQDLWMWTGMMRPVRKYTCVVEPREGRYRCQPLEAHPDEYLVLAAGELELFVVDLVLERTEALYTIAIVAECSTGGQVFSQRLEPNVEFGTYDPEQREPVKDERSSTVPLHTYPSRT